MTRLWHGVLAALALVALIGQAVLVLDTGASLVNFFSYFTIQSNLLVLAAATAIALKPERSGTWWRRLRLAGLMGITVTGVVYTFLIGPYVSFDGAAWWYDKAFHYVVPLLAVIGHVAFRPRTGFRRGDLVVIVWPVVWLGYTMLRAEAVGPSFAANDGSASRYPYDFIDLDRHDSAYVVVACIGVTVVMLAVAWLYVRFSGPARD